MQPHSKFINTTLLICLAFIFRLVFVNANLLSSVNSTQINKFITADLSHCTKKTNQDPVEVAGSNVSIYPDVAVCDEDLDSETDLARANSPAILSIFYSFFNPLIATLKPATSFDVIKSGLHTKKYLSLSILRI